MPAMMQGVQAFAIPGYEVEGGFEGKEAQDVQAKPYNIPPVLWMVIFLAIGYVGLRYLLED